MKKAYIEKIFIQINHLSNKYSNYPNVLMYTKLVTQILDDTTILKLLLENNRIDQAFLFAKDCSIYYGIEKEEEEKDLIEIKEYLHTYWLGNNTGYTRFEEYCQSVLGKS